MAEEQASDLSAFERQQSSDNFPDTAMQQAVAALQLKAAELDAQIAVVSALALRHDDIFNRLNGPNLIVQLPVLEFQADDWVKTVLENLGTGTTIGIPSSDVRLKSLVGTGNTTLSSTATEITINSVTDVDVENIGNVPSGGTGSYVLIPGTDVDVVQAKVLSTPAVSPFLRITDEDANTRSQFDVSVEMASYDVANLTVTQGTGSGGANNKFTIRNLKPENTTLTDTGSGEVVLSKAGDVLTQRRIKAGSLITVDVDANAIRITATDQLSGYGNVTINVAASGAPGTMSVKGTTPVAL